MLLHCNKNIISKLTVTFIVICGIYFLCTKIFFKINDESLSLTVKNFNLPYQSLPPNFKNYKIAFISDIHWGQASGEKLLDNIVKKINSKNIDLLILGGDYIWFEESFLKRLYMYKRNPLYKGLRNLKTKNAVEKIYSDLAKKLSKAKTNDGIIAVYGNHDKLLYPTLLKRIFKRENIILLANNILNIKKRNSFLSIYGFEDLWRGSPFIPKKTKIKNNEFRVFVSHNPDYLSYLNHYTSIAYNLSLSGHTHGGQIVIPFFPIATHTYYKEYFHGIFKRNSSYHYTSSGIGFTTLSFRVNAPPEIAIFTLTSKNQP